MRELAEGDHDGDADDDRLVAGGERGALGDLAVAGGEGDQVHPVEFLTQGVPGLPGGVLDDPQQEQREPAELDVGADAVLAVVEDRPQREGALHVSPAAFDGQQLLVGGGQVLAGEGGVGGA
jgi:hypothetical protein